MAPFGGYRQTYWEDVTVGQVITPMHDEIAYHRIVMSATATGAFFSGHLDPAYAQAQGQPDIYLTTGGFQGLIDRFITDWAGPMTMIRRRKMSMRASIHPGDVVRAAGSVVSLTDGAEGATGGLVQAEVELRNGNGDLCVPATVVFELPKRG
jgi:acyl dehydratase